MFYHDFIYAELVEQFDKLRLTDKVNLHQTSTKFYICVLQVPYATLSSTNKSHYNQSKHPPEYKHTESHFL